MAFYNVLSPDVKNNGIWYSPSDRLLNEGWSSYAVNAHLEYAWPLAGAEGAGVIEAGRKAGPPGMQRPR